MKNLCAKLLASYWADEDGLVTIEWVGIAAVVVVAGILITAGIMESADAVGGDVGTTLSSVQSSQTATIPTFGDGAGGTTTP